MGVTFQREKFAATIDEAKPLLVRHWAELARNRGSIAFNPDYEGYLRLETADILRVYTVRENRILIGYAVYLVSKHYHYKDHLWAASDMFWLDPAKRSKRRPWWKRALGIGRKPGLGTQLFGFIESELHREGISVMHTTLKAAHPAAARMLRNLGHESIELGFAKLLRG